MFYYIILILIVWNFLGFMILTIIPYTSSCDGFRAMFHPKEIYNQIDVNWFGCLILTILFNSLCPVLTVGYWFYWLCTVRKGD